MKNLYIPFRLHPHDDRDIIAFLSTVSEGSRSHVIRAAIRAYMRAYKRGVTEITEHELPMTAPLDISKILDELKK